MEDRGNIRVTDAGRCARFAQKTKPCRFVAEISLADDFQSHGAVQIDVERLVSDAHRTPTQLDRFPVFALHQFIVLKSLHRLFRCRLDRFLNKDSPDSTPPARALRSMQTGQNSIAPENSLPQLGQVRWGSVLMVLTALQPQPEPKATPRSTEWCEIGQQSAWYSVVPFHKRMRYITALNHVSERNSWRRCPVLKSLKTSVTSVTFV